MIRYGTEELDPVGLPSLAFAPKDLRIKLPKQIIANMPVTVGTVFDVYLNPTTNEIILRVAETSNANSKKPLISRRGDNNAKEKKS